MSSEKTYLHACSTCKEETPHASAHRRPLRISLRTWQILVFFLSFAMIYPYTFTTDDEFAVQCTKCGHKSKISCG